MCSFWTLCFTLLKRPNPEDGTLDLNLVGCDMSGLIERRLRSEAAAPVTLVIGSVWHYVVCAILLSMCVNFLINSWSQVKKIKNHLLGRNTALSFSNCFLHLYQRAPLTVQRTLNWPPSMSVSIGDEKLQISAMRLYFCNLLPQIQIWKMLWAEVTNQCSLQIEVLVCQCFHTIMLHIIGRGAIFTAVLCILFPCGV